MSRSTKQCCVSANKNDGFLRVAAASPRIRVADVEGNAEVALAAVREHAERGVRALVLPELNLTGYTAADLFHNRTLLHACEAALVHILGETRDRRLSLPSVFPLQLPRISTTARRVLRGRAFGSYGQEVSAQLW